jgi:hypothetical protein
MQGIGKKRTQMHFARGKCLRAPQPLVNRETVATEMVQSVEQQQPQSFAESAPLANDSSPQRLQNTVDNRDNNKYV